MRKEALETNATLPRALRNFNTAWCSGRRLKPRCPEKPELCVAPSRNSPPGSADRPQATTAAWRASPRMSAQLEDQEAAWMQACPFLWGPIGGTGHMLPVGSSPYAFDVPAPNIARLLWYTLGVVLWGRNSHICLTVFSWESKPVTSVHCLAMVISHVTVSAITP